MKIKFSLKSLFSIGPASITVCTIAATISLYSVGIPILDVFEMKLYDLRFRARAPLPPSPAVVLAAVDEKSLDAEGRWPWPRTKIAKLVDKLGQDGARVIGFDIGFLEPDENSELKLLTRIEDEVATEGVKNGNLQQFIARRLETADNDLTLAKAIANSPADVVLGYFYHMRGEDRNFELSNTKIEEQLDRIRDSRYQLVSYENPDSDPFIKAIAPQSSIPVLTRAADSCGYYSVKSDPDGVVRWMPLVIQCGDDAFPPLSIACVWHYLDRPQLMVDVGKYGVEGVRFDDYLVPTDERGQFLINYVGPAYTFPHYSASDILAGKVSAGTFKDKIVLVGATAMGIFDLRTTPFGPLFPGLEIHANVIDNILQQRFLVKPRWSNTYDLFAVVFLSSVAGLALPFVGPLASLVVTAGLTALYLALSGYVFSTFGFWLNVVYPLIALIGVATFVTVHKYVSEQKERVKVKQTFRQYVPSLVIDEMLKNPERLTMGGEEKELTVLFSDLEGFTSYSEIYSPKEMVGILSEYYERMTEKVFEHRGTLKEYVGDEMMVIFGAPIPDENHAKEACAAALAMRDRLKALQEEWAIIGRPHLRARTGVNTGNMLVGNLGSRYRFAYGVLGDQVNLGSRLEGLNKMYHTGIIIGENTAAKLDGEFLLRELDRVRVKGKKKPVTIFELLEHARVGLTPDKERAYGLYAEGMKAYWDQRWEEAISLFERCSEILPEDGPARVMAERCRLYEKTPPHAGWDGVFEHQSK